MSYTLTTAWNKLDIRPRSSRRMPSVTEAGTLHPRIQLEESLTLKCIVEFSVKHIGDCTVLFVSKLQLNRPTSICLSTTVCVWVYHDSSSLQPAPIASEDERYGNGGARDDRLGFGVSAVRQVSLRSLTTFSASLRVGDDWAAAQTCLREFFP